MARGSGGESALSRHLRVMDAFDATHAFRNLTELSASTGLPISTVHRLVGELTAEGLLERMPDRSYRLGIRLWEYASRTPGALGLREVARPWLAAVHDRVRQHAQLGVLSGQDVLFIERMSAPDAVINATLIGGRMPLFASSSGLVLLAFSSPSLLDGVVVRGIRPLAPHGLKTVEQLRERVRQVRADGFAVTEGFIHPDSRGIAVPVKGPRGPYASMSVVVPNDGSNVMPYVEILQWAAIRTMRGLEEMHLPSHPGDERARHAPLYAGVSRKSLEYFEGLAVGAVSERPVDVVAPG